MKYYNSKGDYSTSYIHALPAGSGVPANTNVRIKITLSNLGSATKSVTYDKLWRVTYKTPACQGGFLRGDIQ